jgi:hypothetical protein
MLDGLLRSLDSTAFLAKGTIITRAIGISKLVELAAYLWMVLNFGMGRIFGQTANEVRSL